MDIEFLEKYEQRCLDYDLPLEVCYSQKRPHEEREAVVKYVSALLNDEWVKA